MAKSTFPRCSLLTITQEITVGGTVFSPDHSMQEKYVYKVTKLKEDATNWYSPIDLLRHVESTGKLVKVQTWERLEGLSPWGCTCRSSIYTRSAAQLNTHRVAGGRMITQIVSSQVSFWFSSETLVGVHCHGDRGCMHARMCMCVCVFLMYVCMCVSFGADRLNSY